MAVSSVTLVAYLIWGRVYLHYGISFSNYFSVVCPFLTPLMAKMNVSFFPSDAVDFFLRSIDKIKKDREKETHKVSRHELVISCGSKLPFSHYTRVKYHHLRVLIPKMKPKSSNSAWIAEPLNCKHAFNALGKVSFEQCWQRSTVDLVHPWSEAEFR